MLNRLVELLSVINQHDMVSSVKSLIEKIRISIEEDCWDGEWFIRAFGAQNKKIGSKESNYGKIFLNTQSWAVLGGIANEDILSRAMDSVKEHLDTKFGPKICAPAFREIDTSIGLITRCVPGKKENAAVFGHPTTWVIQAESLLGRGNHAYHYYKKMLPNAINSDIYQSEPYVYSQYITSDEHETAGMASHSWQTGTAAWMYRVAIDYILGVRPMYDGLLVNPVIPSVWKQFRIERVYRGTRYFITVLNPDGVETGVKEVTINGEKIEGNVLPIVNEKSCHVTVLMGK
jgi:cellobiose phosphorylase